MVSGMTGELLPASGKAAVFHLTPHPSSLIP